jgi:hypothetical protein
LSGRIRSLTYIRHRFLEDPSQHREVSVTFLDDPAAVESSFDQLIHFINEK